MTEKSGERGDKRLRLTRAAADLTYLRGFNNVALADVAEAAEIPLGNVYYYFKTKAALGKAIIDQRAEESQFMRKRWDQAGAPRDRLKAFIQSTVDNRDGLVRAGCPVGSLCAELGKEQTPLGETAARPLRDLRAWIETQFSELGLAHEAPGLALHLLAALQGVSLLANCFRDPTIVADEATRLTAWIEAL